VAVHRIAQWAKRLLLPEAQRSTCPEAEVGAAVRHVEVEAAGAVVKLEDAVQAGGHLGGARVRHDLAPVCQPPRAAEPQSFPSQRRHVTASRFMVRRGVPSRWSAPTLTYCRVLRGSEEVTAPTTSTRRRSEAPLAESIRTTEQRCKCIRSGMQTVRNTSNAAGCGTNQTGQHRRALVFAAEGWRFARRVPCLLCIEGQAERIPIETEVHHPAAAEPYVVERSCKSTLLACS